MSDQPKPTGEWTVFGTSVQVKGEALFHCSTRKDAEIASLEHNAELAAEKDKREYNVKCAEKVIQQLSQQLADERQKVQTLVDALRPFAALSDTPDLQMKIQHEDLLRAKAVIEKVK